VNNSCKLNHRFTISNGEVGSDVQFNLNIGNPMYA